MSDARNRCRIRDVQSRDRSGRSARLGLSTSRDALACCDPCDARLPDAAIERSNFAARRSSDPGRAVDSRLPSSATAEAHRAFLRVSQRFRRLDRQARGVRARADRTSGSATASDRVRAGIGRRSSCRDRADAVLDQRACLEFAVGVPRRCWDPSTRPSIAFRRGFACPTSR